MDCKRIALVAGLVVVLSAVFVGTAAAQSAPDCSTVTYSTDTDGALLVENVDQLQCMNESLSEDYRLANDIDASGTSAWNSGQGFDPVGPDTSTPFTGTLDGDGHVVTGLSISRSTDYLGLFGATDQATVRDLGIEDVNITDETADTVGALAGWTNRTEVRNTHATGTVSVSCCAGGLVGEANVASGSSVGNVFEDVYSEVKVEAPNCCAGGLFGWFEGGSIQDSYATGNVDAENCCAGGLSGWIENL
ncbi:MAG: ZmpA/ZmpB/ZmpC family metallo-endopeptidase-related protein [Halobacteriales archaeon]|nr:ZmpA/ZmpB/ZmpC family metallo-endopeptidase-related protein [Halobacteriales archaeon]